ncbi:hypothetical protein T492DRAFT_1043061 [Pavlovales sp. CCMP2436]|nr:hypothetical protein T492DRAFT_1043061 [Pavlovales sp. CCMP2436]
MPPRSRNPASAGRGGAAAGAALGRRRVVVAGVGAKSKALSLSDRFSQLSRVARGGASAANAGVARRQAATDTQQASRHAKQMASRTGQPAAEFAQAGKASKKKGGAAPMQTDGAGAKGGRGKGRGKVAKEPVVPVDKDALDGDMESYWKSVASAEKPPAGAEASVLAGVPDAAETAVPDTDVAM